MHYFLNAFYQQFAMQFFQQFIKNSGVSIKMKQTSFYNCY